MNQWNAFEQNQQTLGDADQSLRYNNPYPPVQTGYGQDAMHPFYQYQQFLQQEKRYAKQMRRTFSVVGWTLVIYYTIMNAAVAVVMMVDMFRKLLPVLIENPNAAIDEEALLEIAANNGWGYIMAVVIGLFVLLVWKGKDYWKQEIFARGKPMTAGAFFALVSITLGVQLVASLLSTVMELLLNMFGLSMMSILESTSGQSDSVSMFIYASICAPVTEEILFRGYVQRTLQKYGKKFAILGSAILFGLFHGNLIQTPYAFMVGLVLGYVAAEYNVVWAMVLHMVNNMVLADLLTRITNAISAGLTEIVSGLVIIAFGIAATVILIVKRKRVGAYLRQERIDGRVINCFFTNAGVIVLTVMMLINLLLLISPL